jgi:LmeA-like phospholipid-binding
VTISSSPFLVHLAVSGTVQQLHAHVTGVTDGTLRLDSVDVTVRNVKISRSSLSHGTVRLLSISKATVTTTVSVAEMLSAAGYSQQAGLAVLTPGATASVKSGSGRVQITFGSLVFGFSYDSLVPCVGSARVSGTEVILSCSTSTLPPALQTT